MKIIVARYNEDITWSNYFPNVILYNKGVPLEHKNQIMLPNVGREGHTYYQYIVDHYDQLDDYTIFLQGRPFDHSPNVLHQLMKYTRQTPDLEFEWISEQMHHSTFDQQRQMYDWQCGNIYETYQRVFDKLCTNDACIFGAGAQFIVSKRRILQRPKEFYQNIVNILGTSVDPMEGYDIERFHGYIFQK